MKVLPAALIFLGLLSAVAVLTWRAVRAHREAGRAAGRPPVDADNMPTNRGGPVRPWDRPYRGHHWPDPRPAGTELSLDECLVYSELAEQAASWRKVTGALLVWATGGAVGGLIAAWWSNSPDIEWTVLGGLTVVGVLAAWGIHRQDQDSRHWDRVAGAYRARAERLRLEARRARQPLAPRGLGSRLAAAWEAFRS